MNEAVRKAAARLVQNGVPFHMVWAAGAECRLHALLCAELPGIARLFLPLSFAAHVGSDVQMRFLSAGVKK